MSRPSSAMLPRVVVLPGMDGTDLLLDSFRRQLCTPDDPDRVIAVDYPYAQSLSIQDLASLVVAKYLSPLERDRRGYVLVNQSFSGHVGLQLAIRNLRRLRGQAATTMDGKPYLPGAFCDRDGPCPSSRISHKARSDESSSIALSYRRLVASLAKSEVVAIISDTVPERR
ncbi:hypothetical protein BWQ96_07907 [Gracilariopsis chorda]|uniref:Uncharacterized protein n=1 Tax=Gracilariopsis chorda TaxID=448386 RepID=A0A2V3IJY5_9FLOR|nr:hypothetical protein BWQ96_07907 [Gracilariopsis chorda]|eukprot:PXF42387.1 hypothetical protein BWQ96_07907 [Gracilariopsis chorda]